MSRDVAIRTNAPTLIFFEVSVAIFLDKELLNGKGILKIAQIIVNSYT
jgi:hypothetical protein